MKKWFSAAVLLLQVSPLPARDNPAWEIQRIQALRCENQSPLECEETLRRMRYIGTAGTLKCQEGWVWCFNAYKNGEYFTSCCGEADAYEADDFMVNEKGDLVAILTCNGPRNCEEIKGKVVRKPGTKFVIPKERMLVNHSPVNDTGHGWVWINPNSVMLDGTAGIICYAFPSGN